MRWDDMVQPELPQIAHEAAHDDAGVDAGAEHHQHLDFDRLRRDQRQWTACFVAQGGYDLTSA
jgi:hypothetical protein